MKKAILYITVADLVFILLLSVSGAIEGIIGNAVYYSAFLLPIAAMLLAVKREGLLDLRLGLKLSGRDALFALPVLAPSLLLIFFISWLTSLVLSGFSQNSTVDVSGNIIGLVFLHALLPALLEELLFRYIPLKLLMPWSERGALLISSLYFALVHCNLYQIPYAFAAGLIFAALDIMTGSILPSLVFHFVNNTLSLVWMKYINGLQATVLFFSVLAAVALISAVIIFMRRGVYRERLAEALPKQGKQERSYIPWLFAFATLLISVLNLQI